MLEIQENLDLLKICKIQADPGRVSQISTQRDTIIKYTTLDGSLYACLSRVNKTHLESKIDLFSEFWYEFCCLESLYEEQKIHSSKFLQDFEKLNSFYQEYKQRIDDDIAFYTRVYEKSSIQMEEFRKLELTEVGRREVEMKMANRLMNLKDKTGYLGELQETKEKIKAFAEKKAEVEKDWNSSQEILECLKYLKTILVNGKLSRIYQIFNDFLEEIDEVNRFITNIKKEDFRVLKNAKEFSVNEVMDLNEFLCKKMRDFKEISMDFMYVFYSSYVNHESIALIQDQWSMYVQVAGFLAAFPYFNAEIQYFLGKKNKADFKFDSNFSRDHLKWVRECMDNLLVNSQAVGNEIENVIILGETNYTTDEVVGWSITRDSNGHVSKVEVRKPYISSFSSSLYLENPVVPKTELNPDCVEESNRTLEARVFKEKCNRDYAQIYQRFNFYLDINLEYEKLKKKVVDHKNTISINHTALNEELEKLCLKFSNFRHIFTKKILTIDQSFNCSLFSLFLINCNIETCPGCCSGGLKAPLITNHLDTNYLLSCFLKAFKLNKKKMHSSCCEADILKFLNFNGIELDDIRLVLFDLRVIGSLKSNDGKMQEVHGGIREEDFDRAMFNIISQSIKCVAIYSQKRFNIDSHTAIKQIESWQDAGQKIINDNRYKNLIAPYQKAKFTTETRVK